MAEAEWRQAQPILLLLLLLFAFVSPMQPVLREGSGGNLPPDDLTHHHNTTTPPHLLDDVTQRHFAPRDVRGRHEGQDHAPLRHDGPAAGDDVVQTTDNSTGGEDDEEEEEGLERRRRRSSSSSRTLRLAVFSDPTLLHLLAAHHPLHPPTATYRYITALVSAMESLLQQGVGPSPKLRLQLVQAGVWAAKEAVPFRTEGPSSSTLQSFCEWVSQRRAARGHTDHWHHAILLSGRDLFESTQAPLGTTYVGGLCHPSASCSVVEAQSFKAVYIAAHELAHSMGVPHDGGPDAAHCPREGFLMGQSLTQASYRWSNCSKDALAALIKKDRCLEVSQEDGRIAGVHELDHSSGELPGQMYPADEQCRLALGPEHKATPSKMSVCDYLTCTDGLRTQGVHPALEGTACGKNHVCIAGTCQDYQFPEGPPPTLPPQPPTRIPGFPTNLGPGEGSVFPPATIPGEVNSVPVPLRCSLMAPFLHAFIGCASPVSSPTGQGPSPPSAAPTGSDTRRSLSLTSIPASSRTGTLAVDGGLSGLQSRSTGDLQTPGEVSGKASRLSLGTLPDSPSSVPSSPRPATSSISTATTSSATVKASYPPVIANANANAASPSTVTAPASKGAAPPSTVPTTASGDRASSSNVLAFPDDDFAPPGNSVIGERENSGADGRNATTGYTDDKTCAEGDKETTATEDRKRAGSETELQGAALAEHPDVETRNTMTETEEDGGDNNKGMDETMSSDRTTMDSNFTLSALTHKTATDRSLQQQTNVSQGAADRIAEFSLREFNVSGSGLNMALPLEFLRGLFTALLHHQPQATEAVSSPSSKTATGKAASSATKEPASNSFSASYRSAGADAPLRLAHHRGTKPIRPAFLQEGSSQEPILAATAPTHTRAARTAPCSHRCGGGTRLVTQVCVEITEPERQVSEELCNGLPNFVAPFYQSCNTFPCASPRWVTGPWGQCSTWCGVGLQHRLVACGLPLLQDASPLTAGYFLPTRRCEVPQPRAVRLCSGPCLPVDCSLPENALHPACYDLLQDTPLEHDHLP
ncbi:uncharacterized protein [Panulirus ornatus]|uniref:uncharacterized protein n=1 Tax=Panulirus ornatus TaxID=150431 RepID=UPI003A87BF3B